jgi:hypothetical protein
MNVMKRFRQAAIALVIAAGIFGFSAGRLGAIKGLVSPAEGAVSAWAESNTDTLKGVVNYGSFEIAITKPGTYRLVIEAKPPYRNAARDNVVVAEGQTTDVGEIKLEK